MPFSLVVVFSAAQARHGRQHYGCTAMAKAQYRSGRLDELAGCIHPAPMEVFPWMPVCSTNKMPLRAASSLTASLRAPPLAEGTKAGIRGCSYRHSSLLTGRRAMRAASTTAEQPSGEVGLATLRGAAEKNHLPSRKQSNSNLKI